MHHTRRRTGSLIAIVRALEGERQHETPWGVDSEYGRLLDVLLCPPDNFRWLPPSAISRATLDSGADASTRADARASTPRW